MAVPPDARERSRLCDLFDELGPDAPTLCGDWTTSELAAHLVARERIPLALPGIVFGPLSGVTDWTTARTERLGYERLVHLVRTGPPLVPWGLPWLRELLNLNEYVVHHEDVRRANGLGPRPETDLDDAVRPAVTRMAALQLWRGGIDAAVVDERGITLARRGAESPIVRGRPIELLLWLNGRGAVADVAFDGPEAAVSRLWGASLSL